MKTIHMDSLLESCREPIRALLAERLREQGFTVYELTRGEEDLDAPYPQLIAGKETKVINVYLRVGSADSCCRRSELEADEIDWFADRHGAVPVEVALLYC